MAADGPTAFSRMEFRVKNRHEEVQHVHMRLQKFTVHWKSEIEKSNRNFNVFGDFE